MEFTNTFLYSFNQISIVFRNELEKKLGGLGLHYGQVFIIISLWKDDGQSQNSIAQNLGISAPTVNKMIKNLVKEDFVKAVRNEKDARIVNIFLEKKSMEIRKNVEEIWQQIENDISQNLTETEKLIFSQLLSKTHNSLLN